MDAVSCSAIRHSIRRRPCSSRPLPRILATRWRTSSSVPPRWKALFNEPADPRSIQLARDEPAKARVLDSGPEQARIIVFHEIVQTRL